jgi:UDP-N-acetylglucosamine 2-epimerase (non-hydrolysing)
VFPIHPRTEKFLKRYDLYDELTRIKNVTITKPLGYIDFLRLVKEAYKIVTDSGGVQKEAYLLSVPCVTIRKSTEWIETLTGGWNVLSSFNRNSICENILRRQVASKGKVNSMNKKIELIFGRGNTSRIIRKHLLSRYGR